jgi:hypothetical protein
MLIFLLVTVVIILGGVAYVLYPKNTASKFNIQIRFGLLLPILSVVVSYFLFSGLFAYISAFILFVVALLIGLVIDVIFHYSKSKTKT